MRFATPVITARRALRLMALLWLGAQLGACGDGVAWCYGDGNFSAGYNAPQCPPETPPKDGVQPTPAS